MTPDPKIGGIAGGVKYCAGTLLFKFATDVELTSGAWLYGGSQRNDRLAMKSAGHELKSTQALLDAGITQLNFAMMAVFTYRDRRVTCLSLLPVNGRQTLVQGKENAHTRTKLPPPQIEAVMEAMGMSLCIGKSRKPNEEIYGPFDLEIHLGVDGLLYAIDTARLFPPEYRGPESVGSNVFFQLLRPELLQLHGRIMVLPDAVQLQDDQALQDLVELTHALDSAIDRLGEELQQGLHRGELGTRKSVKQLLHSRGINMRYVGRVLAHLQDIDFRADVERRCARAIDEGHVDVKVVHFPPQRSIEELERVYDLQAAALSGAARMQMIPTLLLISALVGLAPLESRPHASLHGKKIPSGHHPMARAFEICMTADKDFVYNGFGSISSCSLETLSVVFELSKWNEQDESCFPRLWALQGVAFRSPPSLLVDRIKRFLASGNDQDELHTAMRAACERGRWDLADSLARQYNRNDLELLVAAEFSNLGLVSKHLSGASVAVKESSLRAACGSGSIKAAVVFLDSLAETLTIQGGQLALVAAAGNGHVASVKLLLDRGVSADAQDSKTSLTALAAAARLGHVEVMRLLLEQGANPNLVDARGRSAIFYALFKGDPPVVLEAVRLLVDNKASLDLMDEKRVSPLAAFCCIADEAIVRELLKLGADVNQKCGGASVPYTALSTSIARGENGIVQALLDYRAEVDYPTRLGMTPLMMATSSGSLDLVLLLLARGARVDLKDDNGFTALAHAKLKKHDHVVELLSSI